MLNGNLDNNTNCDSGINGGDDVGRPNATNQPAVRRGAAAPHTGCRRVHLTNQADPWPAAQAKPRTPGVRIARRTRRHFVARKL